MAVEVIIGAVIGAAADAGITAASGQPVTWGTVGTGAALGAVGGAAFAAYGGAAGGAAGGAGTVAGDSTLAAGDAAATGVSTDAATTSALTSTYGGAATPLAADTAATGAVDTTAADSLASGTLSSVAAPSAGTVPAVSSPSLWNSIFGPGSFGTGASGTGLFGSGVTAGQALSVGSGLYGLYTAEQMQALARAGIGQSNPFGPYRAQYGAQLSQLEANPSSITQYPGYQFSFNQGQQAVTRSMAAQGFTGSGNEATALEQYGQGYATTFLSNEEQMLANLAGAGIAPSNTASLLSGYGMGTQVASQSLASLGYGLGGGGGRGTPIYVPGLGLVYSGASNAGTAGSIAANT